MIKIATRLLLLTCCFIISSQTLHAQDAALHRLFDNYYEDNLKLFPFNATSSGDDRYNDRFSMNGSAPYIKEQKDFYNKYLNELRKFDPKKLNEEDRLSYVLLKYILNTTLKGLSFHTEYIPVNQFNSLALTMGTNSAGNNTQPFKTVKDYEDWLKRVSAFRVWIDTAIANFNKGIAANYVLPKVLVAKMIPQMENLAEKDSAKNIAYGPVKNFPSSFSESDKIRLRMLYHNAISTELVPAYEKLAVYLKNEYLPHARSSSGINALPGGKELYEYYVHFFTTTNKKPEEIYAIGLREVAEMHAEMEKIKTATGFTGSLQEFFTYLTTDKKFFPFKTPEEVLARYNAIRAIIDPNLNKLFSVKPRTAFEIRQTESFRAASAAAQYFSGTPDGKRPGIFYVPIVNALKYPSFSMEDLFLHEAIPGHHYQIMLQREDTLLPLFRRNFGTAAFNEGWALYAETLGSQLGVYTDPYQQMGTLQNQIHRAIRLVVDVGLHTGKMTREDAIKYMRDNEPITEQAATSEIERYMAYPGQALSYKLGQLEIEELRDKYKQQLGKKFSLRDFHDALLKGGSLPASVLEIYMENWAKKYKPGS